MAVPCRCTIRPLGRRGLVHVFVLHVLLSITPCHASPSSERAFAWDFTNRSLRTSGLLTECQEIELSISPLPVPTPTIANNDSSAGALGRPPYSLFAFEPGGISTRTWLDPGAHSPRWVVNRESGSQLVLGLVDSEGRPGGVLDTVFTVSQGDPTCMGEGSGDGETGTGSSAPGIAFRPNISSDVTGSESVPVGGSWDIAVSQGSPPYSILLAALGAPGPLLLPVPGQASVLEYINQGFQNTRVLATVIDSTGSLGLTTPLVHFAGGADANAHGVPQASTAYTASYPRFDYERMRVPSGTGSSDSATIQTSSSHSGLSRTDIIIIAVVLPVVGIMFLCGLGRLTFVLRRRRKERVDAEPHPYPRYIPRPPQPPSLPPVLISPLVLDISSRNNSYVESPVSPRITPYVPTHERRPTSPVSAASSPDRSPTRAPSRQPHRYQQPGNPPRRSHTIPRHSEGEFTYPPMVKRPRQQRSSPALGAAAAHPQSAYHRYQRSPIPSNAGGHQQYTPPHQSPQHPPQAQAPARQLHPSRSTGDMYLQMGGGFRSFSSLREGRIPQAQWQYHHGHRYRVYEYADEPDEPEPIYFQHQDAGGAHPGFYEVPPPYNDDPSRYPGDDAHDRQ